MRWPVFAYQTIILYLIVMEIHIIEVRKKGLASLRKCVPEQQKGGQH